MNAELETTHDLSKPYLTYNSCQKVLGYDGNFSIISIMKLSTCKMMFDLPLPQTHVDTRSGCHRRMLQMHFRTKATSETASLRGSGGLSSTVSKYRVAIKHCLVPFGKDCRCMSMRSNVGYSLLHTSENLALGLRK